MSVWVKKAAEKSGDLMMKRLRGVKQKTPTLPTIKEESRDIILNRLISGEGVRKWKGKGLLLGKTVHSTQFQYLVKYYKTRIFI